MNYCSILLSFLSTSLLSIVNFHPSSSSFSIQSLVELFRTFSMEWSHPEKFQGDHFSARIRNEFLSQPSSFEFISSPCTDFASIDVEEVELYQTRKALPHLNSISL